MGQGFDLEVLRSAAELISRIRRVLLEVPSDACEPLYKGAPSCSEILSTMTLLGFRVANNRTCSEFLGRCAEDDWEFVRDGILPLHDDILPKGDRCWDQFRSGLCDDCDLAAAQELCCTGDLWVTTHVH